MISEDRLVSLLGTINGNGTERLISAQNQASRVFNGTETPLNHNTHLNGGKRAPNSRSFPLDWNLRKFSVLRVRQFRYQPSQSPKPCEHPSPSKKTGALRYMLHKVPEFPSSYLDYAQKQLNARLYLGVAVSNPKLLSLYGLCGPDQRMEGSARIPQSCCNSVDGQEHLADQPLIFRPLVAASPELR
ncbi:hypothetical protein D3C75_712180 [compost metagenome]